MSSPEAAQYFLAIDAGGTKTDLLLADETRERARVRTGSIKLLSVAAAVAKTNLRSGLAELERLSGISPAGVARICVGASGASVPLVAEFIRRELAACSPAELLLLGDEEVALEAAFEGGPGVLALAGTGSNAVGRTVSGRLFSAGGWGSVLADEGSGHWIGLHALRCALRARDEGRPTSLLDAIRQAWGLDALRDVVQCGNASPPPGFAELTPVVLRTAEAGDAVAAEVLALAGHELARLVDLVLTGMRRYEGEGFTVPPIALAGSILQNIAPVRDSMIGSLERAWPAIQVSLRPVDPVLGALWRARHAK